MDKYEKWAEFFAYANALIDMGVNPDELLGEEMSEKFDRILHSEFSCEDDKVKMSESMKRIFLEIATKLLDEEAVN